jgi:hypothetical protein
LHGARQRRRVRRAELYRALCYLALGKRDDADKAVETIVQRDPLYRAPDDIAPRMRNALGDAKKRLLPTIIQQHYNNAKAAFDARDFGVAGEGFQRVLSAMNDPDMTHAAARGSQAVGDRLPRLSAQTTQPPPVAAMLALPPPVQQPVQQQAQVQAAHTVTRIYTGIEQLSGYDEIVLNAARNWRDQPAKASGQAVKFRKSIRITLVADRSGRKRSSTPNSQLADFLGVGGWGFGSWARSARGRNTVTGGP